MLITMPLCNKQVHTADNEKTTTTKTCLYACAAVEQLIAFQKGCGYTVSLSARFLFTAQKHAFFQLLFTLSV